MKKVVCLLLLSLFLVGTASAGFQEPRGPRGPAPNSGDGVPDGSGFENPYGPRK